jgi:hypothetical protein
MHGIERGRAAAEWAQPVSAAPGRRRGTRALQRPALTGSGVTPRSWSSSSCSRTSSNTPRALRAWAHACGRHGRHMGCVAEGQGERRSDRGRRRDDRAVRGGPLGEPLPAGVGVLARRHTCRNRMNVATPAGDRWPIWLSGAALTAVCVGDTWPILSRHAGTPARNGGICGVRDGLANYPARVATQWPFIFNIGHLQSFPTTHISGVPTRRGRAVLVRGIKRSRQQAARR